MNATDSFDNGFPRSASYRHLTAPAGKVRERGQDDVFPYSERHLQCVWFDAAYRPTALRSAQGEDVVVESPGRWNLEAGPDFLDAALIVGPARRRVGGDVEIHVRAADWLDHGHADDALYANVVAHVTYFAGSLPAHALPASAVQIALKDSLNADPSFSFETLDVTAYPHAARPAEPPPCARVLTAWPAERKTGLLAAAGEERLRRKALRLAAAMRERGPDQLLYEEIMAALGYKHNRAPFRQLARRLPLTALGEEAGGDPLAAYALLLGVAGLIPAQFSGRWDAETRAFVRTVWDRWWKRQAAWEGRVLPRTAWKTASLRPQNQPVRRLAVAAGLFAGAPTLAARLNALELTDATRWLAEATALFEGPAAIPYWSRRLGLAGARRPSEEALLGRGRIAATLTNVVVPYLAAMGRSVTPLLAELPAEEDNSLIRQTAHALFGRDHNPNLYAQGLRQQGLLQIFHDFCLSRTGCRECRLADALHTQGPALREA